MKKVFNKIILSICLCLTLTLCLSLFTGCFSTEDTEGDLNTNTVTKEKIEIISSRMELEYNEYLGYTVTIVGTARNVSGRNLSYVSVEFSVYDKNGANIGTALDNLNNLSKGETWSFKASLFEYPEEAPISFRLKDITCW